MCPLGTTINYLKILDNEHEIITINYLHDREALMLIGNSIQGSATVLGRGENNTVAIKELRVVVFPPQTSAYLKAIY
jgi:hypothetical protein